MQCPPPIHSAGLLAPFWREPEGVTALTAIAAWRAGAGARKPRPAADIYR